jgi:hypothetical protein
MRLSRGRVLASLFILGTAGTAAGQALDRENAAADSTSAPEMASGGEPAAPVGPPPAVSPSPEPTARPPAARGPRSLGSSISGDELDRLPLGQGVWSVFETVEPTAILDRMGGAGLYLGEAGLTGVRGSSWTQTSWTLGDLDITDPDRTGTPLFFVDPEALESMDIEAGIAPATLRGVGAGVDLAVRRPGASWHKTVEVHQAPSSLEQAYQRDGAPAIAHLDSLASGLFQAAGPLIKDRLGLFVSATMGRGVRAERADPTTLEGRETGVLAQAVYTPTPRDEVRTLGGYQQLVHPYAGRARFGGADVQQSDHLFTLQSTWQRQGKRPWAVSAGYAGGSFTPDLNPDVGWTIERLDDGPVQQMFPGAGSRGRWSLSGWMDPVESAHHTVRVGTVVSATHSDTRPAEPRGLTPETVGAIGARVWDYGWPGPTAKWRGTEIAAYASDQFHIGPLSLDAGLRFESSRARADGSDGHIDWSAVTPRLLARVRPLPHERPHLVLLGGYAQYLSRLPLNLMAYGDPAAPQGVVYRWVDRNSDGIFQPRERGPLVSRVGPGGSFSSIDPGLKPPRSKEVFLGFETQIGGVHVRGLAYHRIERDLLTSINVGVPLSDYDITFVQDPGDDINGGTTIQMLPIYNRRPESFGLDRYLLTNDSTKGKNKGLELSMEGRLGKRIHLMAGATASTSSSPAAYRGFLAIENDQGLVGERLELPNAATYSKGRLFFERGYTIKIAGTYDAPHDFHLGLIARYQDGQHFARFIIPLDLNQGAEPIRAITNGDSRFTYVLTVDARLEKGFTFGRTRLAGVIEAYNIRGTGIEVEENVEWGPLYRTTSAVQPPRAFRLGLRLDF